MITPFHPRVIYVLLSLLVSPVLIYYNLIYNIFCFHRRLVDSALQLRSIFDHAIWLHGGFDSYQSCLLISVVLSLALCVFNLRLINLIFNTHSIIWRLADSSRQLRSIHHHVICFYYTIGLCQSSCSRYHSLLIWLQFLSPMSTCASDNRILRLPRTLNLVFTIFSNADFNLQFWSTSPSEISFHLLITHLVISLTSRSLSTFFIFFNLFFNSLMYFFSVCKIIYSIKSSPWLNNCQTFLSNFSNVKARILLRMFDTEEHIEHI